jgi:hypothetical protein
MKPIQKLDEFKAFKTAVQDWTLTGINIRLA